MLRQPTPECHARAVIFPATLTVVDPPQPDGACPDASSVPQEILDALDRREFPQTPRTRHRVPLSFPPSCHARIRPIPVTATVLTGIGRLSGSACPGT